MKKVLCAILAIVPSVALSCGGIAAAEGLSHGPLLFAVAFSLLAAVFIINAVWGAALRRRAAALTYMEQEQILSREKAAAEQNLSGVTARLEKTVLYARLYYGILLFLVFTAIFFLAPAVGTGTVYTVLLLFFIYIVWGLLTPMLAAANPADPAYELSETEFPLLFSLVREAAAEAGGTGVLRVCHTDQIAVVTEGNDHFIGLNAPEVLLLTKRELKQVLLHEMAHICRKDTRFNERFRKILLHWDSSDCGWWNCLAFVFLRVPEYYIHYYYELFRLTASRRMELDADRFVTEHGDPAAYIDACAKSAMWRLFREEPCAGMEYYFYENETPPEDIAGYLFGCFQQMKAENIGRWEKILASELPARLDSHPTFRMRMENAGISEYHTGAAESDSAFTAELERLKIRYNEIEQNLYAADYAQLRQERYLARHKILFEYESKNGADDTFCLTRLADTAAAYYGIDTAEAFRILEVILKRDPANAYALFYKGSFLLDGGEETGVSYLYDAIRANDNFTAAALDKIGSFALKYGKQELLAEYRKQCAHLLQAAADKSARIGTVTKRDRIVSNDLPEELFRDVLDYMKEHSQNLIEKIYTAKKIVDQELHTYIYVLRFREYDEADDAEKTWEVYREIFLYLDMLEEQFTLYREDENRGYAEILLKRIPDCCVFDG